MHTVTVKESWQSVVVSSVLAKALVVKVSKSSRREHTSENKFILQV